MDLTLKYWNGSWKGEAPSLYKRIFVLLIQQQCVFLGEEEKFRSARKYPPTGHRELTTVEYICAYTLPTYPLLLLFVCLLLF